MELPRDLQLHIARYLDIDTRRALGIFCRLCIPASLAARLTGLPKPHRGTWHSRVALGISSETLYALQRNFYRTLGAWLSTDGPPESAPCQQFIVEHGHRDMTVIWDDDPDPRLTCLRP